jgi:hypothetical protein
MIDHKYPDEEVKKEIQKQFNKGFAWTKDLVELLGEYETSRNIYPTFKSFYPRIYSFFTPTSNHLSQ